jgi:hypothetical protein
VAFVVRPPWPLCCAFSFNSFEITTLQTLSVSLPSFLASLPLFSIDCGLFSENTRGWGRVSAPNFPGALDDRDDAEDDRHPKVRARIANTQ